MRVPLSTIGRSVNWARGTPVQTSALTDEAIRVLLAGLRTLGYPTL